MVFYYKITIITLFVILLSDSSAQGSFLGNIKSALDRQDYYELETALAQIKEQLSVADQRSII